MNEHMNGCEIGLHLLLENITNYSQEYTCMLFVIKKLFITIDLFSNDEILENIIQLSIEWCFDWILGWI